MYHVIINPASRSGKGKRVWQELEAVLKEHHAQYTPHFTTRAGDAKRFVAQLTGADGDDEQRVGVARPDVRVVHDGLVGVQREIERPEQQADMGHVPVAVGEGARQHVQERNEDDGADEDHQHVVRHVEDPLAQRSADAV